MHTKHPPRQSHPHGDGNEAPPINHAAEVHARAAEAAAHISPPPAGFPADGKDWLAYLEAGAFSEEQKAYLWNPTALSQYEAANATANDPTATRVLAVWRAWLVANPAPPTRNPFKP